MIILLPPSEAKRPGGHHNGESVSVSFSKPMDIAISATEKELKCTGVRYQEGITLNRTVEEGPWMSAIDRYDGVMYRSLGYHSMPLDGQKYFDQHVCVLSGMYGILRPQDQITNYKLPISTRLKHYRKDTITTYIKNTQTDSILDLLPESYHRLIDRSVLDIPVITVEWRTADGNKLSHGVKKLKGERLREYCLNPYPLSEQAVDGKIIFPL